MEGRSRRGEREGLSAAEGVAALRGLRGTAAGFGLAVPGRPLQRCRRHLQLLVALRLACVIVGGPTRRRPAASSPSTPVVPPGSGGSSAAATAMRAIALRIEELLRPKWLAGGLGLVTEFGEPRNGPWTALTQRRAGFVEARTRPRGSSRAPPNPAIQCGRPALTARRGVRLVNVSRFPRSFGRRTGDRQRAADHDHRGRRAIGEPHGSRTVLGGRLVREGWKGHGSPPYRCGNSSVTARRKMLWILLEKPAPRRGGVPRGSPRPLPAPSPYPTASRTIRPCSFSWSFPFPSAGLARSGRETCWRRMPRGTAARSLGPM